MIEIEYGLTLLVVYQTSIPSLSTLLWCWGQWSQGRGVLPLGKGRFRLWKPSRVIPLPCTMISVEDQVNHFGQIGCRGKYPEASVEEVFPDEGKKARETNLVLAFCLACGC